MAESIIKNFGLIQTDFYITEETDLLEIVKEVVRDVWKKTYNFYATPVGNDSIGNMMIMGYKASDVYFAGIILKHAGTNPGVWLFKNDTIQNVLH